MATAGDLEITRMELELLWPCRLNEVFAYFAQCEEWSTTCLNIRDKGNHNSRIADRLAFDPSVTYLIML